LNDFYWFLQVLNLIREMDTHWTLDGFSNDSENEKSIQTIISPPDFKRTFFEFLKDSGFQIFQVVHLELDSKNIIIKEYFEFISPVR